MLGSYWTKRVHWVICIECGYHRHGVTYRRAHRLAHYHEKFHPGHTVQTDMDRLSKPAIKNGWIG
jgi:hypothetical protein